MQTATLPWVVRLPRVYRPQADTRLLATALADAVLPRGGRVLDLCTGSGTLAVTAPNRHQSNSDPDLDPLRRRGDYAALLWDRAVGLPSK